MNIISAAGAALVPGLAEMKISGRAIVALIALAAFAVPTVGWYVDHSKLATRTEQRDTLQRWQGNIRQTTSTAAHIRDDRGRPGVLAADQVEKQVIYLGDAVDQLRGQLAQQGASIVAAGADGQARVDQGSRNLAKVQEGKPAADARARDLRASAADTANDNKACTDSAAFLKHSGEL